MVDAAINGNGTGTGTGTGTVAIVAAWGGSAAQ
jgi:hypothetical protein